MVTAIDTNLLLYALNASAPEHGRATAFLKSRRDDSDTLLSELVLVELYVLLRNASVVRSPLSAPVAAGSVERFRRHPRWRLVDHDPTVMQALWKHAATPGFARTRIFDVRLALGLRAHGVEAFATANTKDFQEFGFQKVWNPLAEA